MFNGFEGLDLSNVEASDKRTLQPGRHVVTITEAKIVKDDARKTHQLELAYQNDDGTIRNWIYVNHPGSAEATRIGLEQLKSLLLTLGHDGNQAPGVDYFKGKKVGINIKEEKYTHQGQQKTRLKVNYHFTPTASDATASSNNGGSGAGSNSLEDEIPW